MQLRLITPPALKASGSGFKQSASVIFTWITLASTFSTVAFNSQLANQKASEAFQSISNFLNQALCMKG